MSKPNGFKNETQWIQKQNPLDLKVKSIGFENEIHWI